MTPYPLRLPSYRSSHGRRYHPYPTARRHTDNDEFYMDPVRDFDFEAAEHVLELPPDLQLHPTRRGNDGDDDVTAFNLDGCAPKDAKAEKGGNNRVVVAGTPQAKDTELKVAVADRLPAKLAKLYTLFFIINYIHGRIVKGTHATASKAAPK